MVTISNSELDQCLRLLRRLVDYAGGDETRDRENRRLAQRLMAQLVKRKDNTRQHGKLIKVAKA